MSRKKSIPLRTPEICPVCGEDVPLGRLACPECGADHNSGWRKDADAYDGIGLPDEEQTYDEFVQQEFGESPKPVGIKPVWWITAILLIMALIAAYLQAVF